jgi:putative ABC transport system ATP-binding protein
MLIEVGGLKHRIGGRPVLDAPDWRQAAGEHALVLGPSGSGKTTLINIVAGLITPTQGLVTIDGQAITSLPAAKRDAVRRRTIGLVFQTLRLIPALNVRQNLALAQRIALGRSDGAEVDRLIAAVGIAHRADAKPRELSQGEGQRAAIARALATRPKLVIADEPTSALDDANAERVIDLLLATAEKTGATLLIATHDGRIRHRFARTIELAAPKLKAAA